MESLPLAGLRILIVEDETLVSFLHEDTLIGAGCAAVSIASTLQHALNDIATGSYDVAVLDINLSGEESWPVADALRKNNVPFIICTGYGARHVPEAYADIILMAKPYLEIELVRALKAALRR